MIDYLTFYLFTCIILIHYIADFPFQTSEMALNKSKCNKALDNHVRVYSSVVCILSAIFIFYVLQVSFIWLLLYLIYTYVTHFGTDYVTSRLCSKYFSKQDYHMGFVIVGADQCIHFLTTITFFALIAS